MLSRNVWVKWPNKSRQCLVMTKSCEPPGYKFEISVEYSAIDQIKIKMAAMRRHHSCCSDITVGVSDISFEWTQWPLTVGMNSGLWTRIYCNGYDIWLIKEQGCTQHHVQPPWTGPEAIIRQTLCKAVYPWPISLTLSNQYISKRPGSTSGNSRTPNQLSTEKTRSSLPRT